MRYTSNMKLPISKGENDLIFLAGSVPALSDLNWRNQVVDYLGDTFDFIDPVNHNIVEFDEGEMERHVEWELEGLQLANRIIVNFLPEFKSPISLVELGLYMATSKLTVICPKAFYKSDYITTLCKKYKTPLFLSLEEALETLNKD